MMMYKTYITPCGNFSYNQPVNKSFFLPPDVSGVFYFTYQKQYQAMETHNIETKHIDGMAFSTDLQGHEVVIDATIDHGGQNLGPRPKHLLLTSLAGCTGMDVVSLLRKMRVAFSDFSVAVTGELTDEQPKYYHTIMLEYKIKLANQEDQPKVEKAITLSKDRYCGVSAMLSKAAEIKYRITYL
jgi:putative redox protein